MVTLETNFRSWIKNVADGHEGTPLHIHTPSGLQIEIANARRLQENLSDKAHYNLPLVFLMSGTSESGKSTIGNRLLSEQIATRYKLLTLIGHLQNEGVLPSNQGGAGSDPLDLLDQLGARTLLDQAHSLTLQHRLVAHLNELDTPIAVVETIRHPWLITDLAQSPVLRSISFFIDADLEQRIRRETKKTGLASETIRENIRVKDSKKSESGNIHIRRIADIIVNNNGNVEDYIEFIDALGNQALQTTRPFSGTPIQYSLG